LLVHEDSPKADRSVQRRPDWDKEGRERRAREHGRERATVDTGSVDELDAVLAARAKRGNDAFHALAEPARRVAAEYRRIPKGEKSEHYDAFLARVQSEIENTQRATSSPKVRAQLDAYGRSLKQRFFKTPK
jgi:hypothetical protein